MSASTAPVQSATDTPVKGARAKPQESKDAKSGEAQSAVSASLAVQPLIASGLAAQGSPQDSTRGMDAAGADSSSDASSEIAASATSAVTGASADRTPVTPAIAAALPAARQPVARDVSEPASLEEGSRPVAASPDSGGGSAAPDSAGGGSAAAVSAPFHAALQSALSAASRLDGASQTRAASQPPGTTNDPASMNAALSAAATPGATAREGASAAPQAAAPATLPVHSEVGSTGWANELGTRLHWMANAGLGSASLRLTPEQLGPVEVKISVHQNAASVWFSAAQPDTRSALEQALPRLRELFSAQGMNLAQAGVSDQSARGTPREPQTSGSGPHTGGARELNATLVTSAVRARQGLIDTYA